MKLKHSVQSVVVIVCEISVITFIVHFFSFFSALLYDFKAHYTGDVVQFHLSSLLWVI